MDKEQILANLCIIADQLDKNKAYKEANDVTRVMRRIAQVLSLDGYHNEAGEPLMSAEDMFREQRADQDAMMSPDDSLDLRDPSEERLREEIWEEMTYIFDNNDMIRQQLEDKGIDEDDILRVVEPRIKRLKSRARPGQYNAIDINSEIWNVIDDAMNVGGHE